MDLIKEVNLHFEELARLDRDGHAGGPIRGSAIGHCPRRLYAKLLGLEQRETTARSKRIFTIGDDRDAMLTEALTARLGGVHHLECEKQKVIWTTLGTSDELSDSALHAAVEHYNQRFAGVTRNHEAPESSLRYQRGRLQVRSRADFVWNSMDMPIFNIAEIKTMGSYPFKKAKEQGAEGMGYDYKMQLMTQMVGLNSVRGIGQCGWLIECKDNSELEWVPFVPTEEDWNEWHKKVYDTVELLINWSNDAPLDIAPAIYAEQAMQDSEFAAKNLPWQCNYCDIGPEVGHCTGNRIAHNQAKEGEIPKWRVITP